LGGFYGLLAGLAIAPVTATGGCVYGALAASKSEEEMKAGERVGAQVIEVDYQAMLKDILLKALNQSPRISLVRSDFQGSASPETWRDFRGTEGVDTILEAGIQEVSIRSEGVTNKDVRLWVWGKARLLPAPFDAPLFEKYYSYFSPSHHLMEWGDPEKDLFRQELEAVIGKIVDTIYKDIAFMIFSQNSQADGRSGEPAVPAGDSSPMRSDSNTALPLVCR